MIESLHIENFALIDRTDIDFKEGFNVLTGETGAGKSILLGALSLALGKKPSRDSVRDPEKDCYAEVIFSVTPEEEALLKEIDVDCYDGEVILSRRVGPQKSQAKINGESVPAPKLEKTGELLLDIYGQKEHQSLLKISKHLALIDSFAGAEMQEKKAALKKAYEDYSELRKKYDSSDMNETERERRAELLSHEIAEIENAHLQPDEDISLENEFRTLSHGRKIMEGISESLSEIDGEGGAAERIERALRSIGSVKDYDSGEALSESYSMLSDISSILSDAERSLKAYADSADFSEQHFNETAERLDLVNSLKDRYGRTIEIILSSLEKKKEELEELSDFESHMKELSARLSESRARLSKISDEVSELRKTSAERLSKAVRVELADLNFPDSRFEAVFTEADEISSNGKDNAEFFISLNVGEPMRPLKDVASGGELSRIELALKSVHAGESDKGTMIFDEIDSGISGRTADAVAEKLSSIAKAHQVICITHLQQIAAMADDHILIEKKVEDQKTCSYVKTLSFDESVEELARMLGGNTVTETVLADAREMKERAVCRKKGGD